MPALPKAAPYHRNVYCCTVCIVVPNSIVRSNRLHKANKAFEIW